MSIKVYMIYGQGGPIFSPGFRAFGQRLDGLGFDVSFWMPRRPDLVVAQIKSDVASPHPPIAVLGYSLGGNAVSWVADGLGETVVDLAVAYDPTLNSYVTPLRSNVRRAISYHQTGLWGTSLMFGRNVLASADDGPEVEVHDVCQDHLLVQFNENLHQITLAALRDLDESAVA